MMEVPVGFLPSSSMSPGAGGGPGAAAAARDTCEELLDEIVPLVPAGGDFRGKFRKMRQRKRPTILESRCRRLNKIFIYGIYSGFCIFFGHHFIGEVLFVFAAG